MALIPQEEITALRQCVDIVEVISSYIPLDHKGKNYFGVCPFHADHSPSMSVSKEKQIYKCFSCGAAGNVFTFVQNYENVSFAQAVEIIAQKVGFHLSTPIKSIQNEKYSHYYEIMEVSSKYFTNNLKTEQGKAALEYLAKRFLDNNAIKEFNIGLALKNKDLLYQILKSKNYQEKDLENLGLINNHEQITDVFINRVMFPLHDPNGNIIGFSGRLYDNSEGPKYLNTRETIIFKKGQMLFNYHRAKNSIQNNKSIILVEGYMDAIRLYLNGVKNVVAIMGTSLTSDQIKLIQKLHCKVILCLDSDEPGQKATYEIGNILKNQNFEVEVIRLTGNKDPDEYIINQGIDAFKKNLNSPIKFLDFTINYLKQNKNLNETVDLANYVNDVLKDLSKEKDPILIDITLKKLADTYNLDYEILQDKLKQIDKLNKDIKQERELKFVNDNKNIKLSKYEKTLKNLLFFMMNDAKYVRIYQENLVFINEAKYREIVKEILYYYELHQTINLADFLSFVTNNENVLPDVLNIVNVCSDIELEETAFYDFLKSIKVVNEKQTIKELKEKLKNCMDKNEKIKIANQIAEIKKGCV